MSLKKIKEITKLNKYDFIHINKTASTKIDLKNFLIKYKKNCVILADQQTSGTGQRGSYWHSPKGNIYCSISFDNFLEFKNYFLFSILIAISIKKTLKLYNVENIKFKWPNDIFFKNKKFCGIISELYQINNLQSYAMLGFGINIESSPKIKNIQTTYINSFCEIENLFDFLFYFFEILFLNLKYLLKNKYNYLIDEFNESLLFLEEKIKIKLPDSSIVSGIFKGINSDGSLKLQNNNKIKNLYNGSIIL